jgi:hypothetical protein
MAHTASYPVASTINILWLSYNKTMFLGLNHEWFTNILTIQVIKTKLNLKIFYKSNQEAKWRKLGFGCTECLNQKRSASTFLSNERQGV